LLAHHKILRRTFLSQSVGHLLDISEIFIKNANQQVGWHCVDFLTTESAFPQAVKDAGLAAGDECGFRHVTHSRAFAVPHSERVGAAGPRRPTEKKSGPFGESSLPSLRPPGD
jgi:hypothetical protein